MAARLAAAALGVWLMAAPGVLGSTGAQGTSMHVTGPVTAALGAAAASPVLDGLRRALLLPAGWLIGAPWFLGGGTAAACTSVTVGLLLVALARVARTDDRAYGGGWRAVAPLLRRRRDEGRVRHG